MKLNKSFCLFMTIIISGCFGEYGQRYLRDYNVGVAEEATVNSTLIAWGLSNGDLTGDSYALRDEFIYDGVDKDVVKLIYRKLVNVPAQEIFNQNYYYQALEIDLRSTKIITYQDVKIEVLDANSERIRFKLLEPPLMGGYDKMRQIPLKVEQLESKYGFTFIKSGAVKHIRKDSPAYRCGLQVGDKITEVNEGPIDTLEIMPILKKIDNGFKQSVALQILRDGSSRLINVHCNGYKDYGWFLWGVQCLED